MSTELISDYWHELHSRQSDWAFRAYARLVGTLSEDVQEKLRFKKDVAEPYVVIFGKTQVGKTTLLLDLMGIDPAQMRTISEVMRGGREHGKSATATAMEYCGSADERWGLSIQSNTRWFDFDKEITHELGRIRKAMENGDLVADSPCVVHIPKRFFGTANGATPRIRILDLPGDNPANEVEQKHVNQMAKTYLPFADLILLVGRGDDLGFLRPDVITLPGIEDWQAIPHRFRIVTTYSYTAQSVKDILRHNPNADAALLRQRLIHEIERFGIMSEGAKAEERYFPLEFGTSWRSVQANEPELYHRISPIISQLRAELLDQISKATAPMGRLRSTLNTHLSVKYIQKKKTETIEAQYARLDAKEKEIVSDLARWEKAIEQAQRKLSKLEEILESPAVSDGKLLIEKAASNPKFSTSDTYPPKEKGIKNNCKTLIKLIDDYYQVLQRMRLDARPEQSISRSVGAYWTQVRKVAAEPDRDAVLGILQNAFYSIGTKLCGYSIQKYWFSDNYKKDLDIVLSAGDKAKEDLVRLWKQAWLTAFNKVHQDYRDGQHSAQSDVALNSAERDKSRVELKDIEEKKLANRTQLERIVRTSQEDLKRCDRFVHFLDEEYLTALSERMSTAVKTDDDCDALLQLISCAELKYQHKDFMELNKKVIY